MIHKNQIVVLLFYQLQTFPATSHCIYYRSRLAKKSLDDFQIHDIIIHQKQLYILCLILLQILPGTPYLIPIPVFNGSNRCIVHDFL